jgi:hypothetical protein
VAGNLVQAREDINKSIQSILADYHEFVQGLFKEVININFTLFKQTNKYKTK